MSDPNCRRCKGTGLVVNERWGQGDADPCPCRIATLTRERDEARAESQAQSDMLQGKDDAIAELRHDLAAARAAVAEALKYGAPANATSLSFVTHKCGHNDYWKTHDGKNCMACRAERAEADVAALKARILELENQLIAIGDKVICDWDEPNADILDVTKKITMNNEPRRQTYREWMLDLYSRAGRTAQAEARVEGLDKQNGDLASALEQAEADARTLADEVQRWRAFANAAEESSWHSSWCDYEEIIEEAEKATDACDALNRWSKP